VSETLFERSILVAASPSATGHILGAGEALFRLNPEWEVLALSSDRLLVRYESTDLEAAYVVSRRAEPGQLEVDLAGEPARHFRVAWPAHGDGIRLEYRESFAAPLPTARLAELQVWLRAVAGYLALASRSSRRARVLTWLIDRIWLRMSPTARRVSLLIVAMDLLALLLLVAVLLVMRWWA
jgi:hypothetical protein